MAVKPVLMIGDPRLREHTHIYYFSGTGNSLAVARGLRPRLPRRQHRDGGREGRPQDARVAASLRTVLRLPALVSPGGPPVRRAHGPPAPIPPSRREPGGYAAVLG